MSEAMLDGHYLHYEAEGEGEPVLLISGLGGLASSWREQVAPFSRHFRCVTYDHMGAGRSAQLAGSYSIDSMADNVMQLMDILKIEAAHLVGHSTGGAIAQTIACRAPARVKRMVLHSSWATADPYFRLIFSMRREILCRIGVEAYLRSTAFFIYPPWWINENETAIEASVAAGLAQHPNPEILARRIDAILAFDRSAELSAVKASTLVTAATNDVLNPPHTARRLKSLIPGAHLVFFSDGGHVAHQITPAKFNDAVLDFLLAKSPR